MVRKVSFGGGGGAGGFNSSMRDSLISAMSGMLNHAVKECPEKSTEKNQLAEGYMQYGAWLRGEPLRRKGWDLNQMGVGPRELNRSSFVAGEPKKPWQHPSGPVEEKQGGKVDHVSPPSNAEPSDQKKIER